MTSWIRDSKSLVNEEEKNFAQEPNPTSIQDTKTIAILAMMISFQLC